jgi:hypothetical protein
MSGDRTASTLGDEEAGREKVNGEWGGGLGVGERMKGRKEGKERNLRTGRECAG